MLIWFIAVWTCASPSISYIRSCRSPSCARGHSTRLNRFSFVPLLRQERRFLDLHPQTLAHPMSVARIQKCKSMHHFSPALRFDIDKSGCYSTASPLVRWVELHWCPTALFSSSERGAAGMDLQNKCSCVCARESSGTKRPFQSADHEMEKSALCGRQINQKQKPGCRSCTFIALEMHRVLRYWEKQRLGLLIKV